MRMARHSRVAAQLFVADRFQTTQRMVSREGGMPLAGLNATWYKWH